MKSYKIFIALVIFTFNLNATVVLDGKNISTQDIVKIANGDKVEIDKSALARVEKSHEILLNAAKDGQKIYGLTVGVGLNKDKSFVNAKGDLSNEVIEASTKFNLGLIHAHCGGVGNDLDIKTSRAVLAIRLNNMLFGGSGVKADVVNLYKEFLNQNIIPRIPSNGSMGEADITILGHIGLAMIGEGEVYYKGQKVEASEALKKANLKQLVPFGKDSLSIISSNAYSAALASIVLEEYKHIFEISKKVYAISLEALNGNISPFLPQNEKLRPFDEFIKTTKDLREILKDSYLWEKDETRALQDPLSFRDATYFLAAMRNNIMNLEKYIKIQLNSSDDNPGIFIGEVDKKAKFNESKLFTDDGAVVPTSNFEPILWVLEFEKASIVLAHNSKISASRTIKLGDENFTHLSRFLGTKNTVHAFGAMQKPFVALSAQNEFLANPASLNYIPVAGNIEDVATNAPFVVKKFQSQLENFYSILGIELLHAAQAIDLRKEKNPNLKLSKTTQKLYDEYRKVVKFMQIDRPLSDDFKHSANFLKYYERN